jgi:DNA (cytosine-5)-methyltransferase 1
MNVRKESSSSRPIAIDLFAGAGGFSLGMEQSGFDIAVAIDEDPVCAAVYEYNKPHTKVVRANITEISREDILKALSSWRKGENKISVVFGGPPCQGFSIIGKGNADDARNNLIFEFCRLVIALKAEYFVMENVPGLLSHRYKHLVEELISRFKKAGYQITEPIQVLDASLFGVPQKRRRVFILGAREDKKPLEYPTIPLEIEQPNRRITVREAIADLPNLDDFEELKERDWVELSGSALYRMQKSASNYVRLLRNLTVDETDFSYPRLWNPRLLTNSWRTEHDKESLERFKKVAQGKMDQTSRLKRLYWENICWTLRAGTDAKRGAHTSSRPLHPEHPRVISVKEAARLQSFPDWFRFHVTKWHGFREVGNAVPPLLGRAIGEQLIKAMEHKPCRPETTISLGNSKLLELEMKEAALYWTKKKYSSTR